jgi:hypothetical protein
MGKNGNFYMRPLSKEIKNFEIFIGPFQIGSHSGWGDPGYGRLNKAYF